MIGNDKMIGNAKVFCSQNYDDMQPSSVFIINCGSCISIDDWRQQMARVLKFPDYYWMGNEWDSLVDMLLDLDWIASYNITIVLREFDIFYNRVDSNTQKNLIKTLLFCVDNCQNTKPTCKALKLIVE